MRRFALFLAFAGLLLVPAVAPAQSLPPEDARIVLSAGFLEDHPDLKWRKRGIEAYRQGRKAEALQAFTNAARYADKPSQAMIAEMLWQGDGVARDRPRAYAWSDLAAERGWPDLVAKREYYWANLDAAEREQAIDVGQPLLHEYGDDVARPRIDLKLSQARRRTTGSRVGHVGNLVIRMPAVAGDPLKAGHDVDGARFYADRFYRPADYHAWQEQTWRERGEGLVEVGSVEADPGTVTEARE